jgi:hypothetical protein
MQDWMWTVIGITWGVILLAGLVILMALAASRSHQ